MLFGSPLGPSLLSNTPGRPRPAERVASQAGDAAKFALGHCPLPSSLQTSSGKPGSRALHATLRSSPSGPPGCGQDEALLETDVLPRIPLLPVPTRTLVMATNKNATREIFARLVHKMAHWI